MRSFSEKLHLLLSSQDPIADQITSILAMIDEEIIGDYETSAIPEFSDAQSFEAWTEQDEMQATRNDLRKEQRERLGPGWHERRIDLQQSAREGQL